MGRWRGPTVARRVAIYRGPAGGRRTGGLTARGPRFIATLQADGGGGGGGMARADKKRPGGLVPSGPERGRLPTFPLSQYHRRGEV